jgi:hypothetical protein
LKFGRSLKCCRNRRMSVREMSYLMIGKKSVVVSHVFVRRQYAPSNELHSRLKIVKLHMAGARIARSLLLRSARSIPRVINARSSANGHGIVVQESIPRSYIFERYTSDGFGQRSLLRITRCSRQWLSLNGRRPGRCLRKSTRAFVAVL